MVADNADPIIANDDNVRLVNNDVLQKGLNRKYQIDFLNERTTFCKSVSDATKFCLVASNFWKK